MSVNTMVTVPGPSRPPVNPPIRDEWGDLRRGGLLPIDGRRSYSTVNSPIIPRSACLSAFVPSRSQQT